MKLSIFRVIFCLLIIFSHSCNSKTKAKQDIKNLTVDSLKISDSLTFDEIKGKLFYFQPSLDPNYCDSTKIIETDCGVGYFYFSKKGKVCFTYECVGDTSIQYFLGDYSVKDNKINCFLGFEKECQLDDSEKFFKSISPLKKLDKISHMTLEKAPCKNILAYDNSDDSQKEFWFIKEVTKTDNYFWNFYIKSGLKADYF